MSRAVGPTDFLNFGTAAQTLVDLFRQRGAADPSCPAHTDAGDCQARVFDAGTRAAVAGVIALASAPRKSAGATGLLT